MKAEDQRIRQILVGLEIHTVNELEAITKELSIPRSQIIREAVDLWLRAYKLRNKDGNHNPGQGPTG